MTAIWQGFGFETVVFLAALQAIPREYYEAATVDGAGRWAQFRWVTLPGLRPTIVFVYVIGIIGSFQTFDQVFVMTNGRADPVDPDDRLRPRRPVQPARHRRRLGGRLHPARRSWPSSATLQLRLGEARD